MAKFNINPTLINGLTTTYVSKDGDDVSGSGTTTAPYASINKATSGATAGTNIVLGNGVWEEQRFTTGSKAFKFWGCGNTVIKRDIISFNIYSGDHYNYIDMYSGTIPTTSQLFVNFYNCLINEINFLAQVSNGGFVLVIERCVFRNNLLNIMISNGQGGLRILNSVFINNTFTTTALGFVTLNNTFYFIKNNIFYNTPLLNWTQANATSVDYNNHTTSSYTFNGSNPNGINDTSTGQDIYDYFNNFTKGDYTAKLGSANIGAGAKFPLSDDIGFSRGYATLSTDSVFSGTGATLQNLVLTGDTIRVEHTNFGVVSATTTSITLDTSASSVDDYYNGLFIRISFGTGINQVREILDYDGTSKVATVSTWDVIPSSDDSVYELSGFFESDDIDIGKVIKVKKVWFNSLFQLRSDSSGIYEKYFSSENTGELTDDKFYVFALKYSSTSNLNIRPWIKFQINGRLLYDGTYGDGDDNYNIQYGTPLMFRYYKIKFRFLV